MERRISDMLDDLQEDKVSLRERTPLSARRIRKMTMEHFEEKRHHSFRWLGKVAVVAAVIMALTITVFAADVVLGDGKLFGSFFGDVLTESQMAVVDDIGRDFSDSTTSLNGTITPIRAVADTDHYMLHLRVEAPQGVVLPDLDEDEYRYYDFERGTEGNSRWFGHGIEIQYFLAAPRSEWVDMSFSHSVTALEDADPTDNVKEFVISFSRGDTYATFNGPWQKRLFLPGLFIREYGSTETVKVFEGSFIFDIGIDDKNRDDSELVVELDGLSFHNEDYDFDVTLEKVTITPLSITVDYEASKANNRYIFPEGGPIQLVMKDGTVIDARDAYYDARGKIYPHPDSVSGVGNYSCFDQIIVVSDIDYLLIDGVHKVDVN